MSTRINGASILERVPLDASRWIVLCEDRQEDCTRYRVGIATATGRLAEDALHATLQSARADFDARRALASGAKA